MKTLYLECYSGISGDMTVAALLSLGADEAALRAAFASLKLEGCRIEISDTVKMGIAAKSFDVIEEHHDEHDHDHSYHHAHDHTHRNIADIFAIINGAAITENAKAMARRIFTVIAEAEAKVHGKPVEEVHFHEVGAVDSIVDIVAASVLIDSLHVDKIVSSPLFEGTGYVKCKHGLLPVPAPAVAGIAEAYQIPLKITNTRGEMVTPTGAGIIAALCGGFNAPPVMRVKKIGVGTGKKDFEHANVLRIYLLEEDADPENFINDRALMLECNIDDCSGEILAAAMEELLVLGAYDVSFSPIFAKKNRPATKLSVICNPTDEEKLLRCLFSSTTTIGVRRQMIDRVVMERRMETVGTPYGTVEVKVCRFGDLEKKYPEYESVKRIASENKISVERMFSIINGLLN